MKPSSFVSWKQVILCLNAVPEYGAGSRNEPTTILAPSPSVQANLSAFCLFTASIATVLKDAFWRMNSWRRGWPKAPPAPMVRTDIDMTRNSKLDFSNLVDEDDDAG